jgi:cation diffusion facilitator family transporter
VEGDHGHHHGAAGDPALLGSREGLRTLGRSLAILAATALVQAVVVVASGSVALLADAVHNVGDALTAIPLGAAFLLARRPPTRRLTYGFGRAEDLAGLVVVAIILFSALYTAYESVHRLIDPSRPGHLLAVALAGAVGFIGNEWVAVDRIRTGRRIGSAALVADGRHARVDGLTSLAVIAGALGVAAGFSLADPIVGLAISVVILGIVWRSLREVGLRILDGIEPERVDAVRREAACVAGVVSVNEIRARWVGHTVHAEVNVVVPAGTSVEEAHATAMAVRERLLERVDHLGEAIVHVDPPSAAGEGHHPRRRVSSTG